MAVNFCSQLPLSTFIWSYLFVWLLVAPLPYCLGARPENYESRGKPKFSPSTIPVVKWFASSSWLLNYVDYVNNVKIEKSKSQINM